MNTDTPLPPDEPAGENPPDGAVIDYWIKSAPAGPVTLEILDGEGALVRRVSSAEPPDPIDPNLSVPMYWPRPPQALSAAPGMHRFVWDLHYPPAPGSRPGYPIAAVAHGTAPSPSSPWVMPGEYTVRLTVNDQSQTAPLTVRMDPRVDTADAALAEQFRLSKQMYDGIVMTQSAIDRIGELRGEITARRPRASGAAGEALDALDKKAAALEGGGGRGRGFGGAGLDTLGGVSGSLGQMMSLLQGADRAPTPAVVEAVTERQEALGAVMRRWNAIRTGDVPKLNDLLAQAGLPPIPVPGR
jgi:hypothetical protein